MIFGQQSFDQYAVRDQETWSVLFKRQMTVVKSCSYRHFPEQLKKLAFNAEKIPDMKKINVHLEEISGWNMYPLPGLLTNELFFRLLNFRKFGVRTRIREKSKLDTDQESDMFSDVFGHAPLLADPVIAAFVLGLARIAKLYSHIEDAIQVVCRLYWYTLEYGLVKEGGEIKVYGGSLLASASGAEYALSAKAYRQPFNLDLVLNTAWVPEAFQEQFFVLDSFSQLRGLLKGLDYLLRRRIQ